MKLCSYEFCKHPCQNPFTGGDDWKNSLEWVIGLFVWKILGTKHFLVENIGMRKTWSKKLHIKIRYTDNFGQPILQRISNINWPNLKTNIILDFTRHYVKSDKFHSFVTLDLLTVGGLIYSKYMATRLHIDFSHTS